MMHTCLYVPVSAVAFVIVESDARVGYALSEYDGYAEFASAAPESITIAAR
jgi:hypothetical protein